MRENVCHRCLFFSIAEKTIKIKTIINVKAGNPYQRGGLITVDLLIKIGCFVIKEKI
jgi:hypothetical protein